MGVNLVYLEILHSNAFFLRTNSDVFVGFNAER